MQAKNITDNASSVTMASRATSAFGCLGQGNGSCAALLCNSACPALYTELLKKMWTSINISMCNEPEI